LINVDELDFVFCDEIGQGYARLETNQNMHMIWHGTAINFCFRLRTIPVS